MAHLVPKQNRAREVKEGRRKAQTELGGRELQALAVAPKQHFCTLIDRGMTFFFTQINPKGLVSHVLELLQVVTTGGPTETGQLAD